MYSPRASDGEGAELDGAELVGLVVHDGGRLLAEQVAWSGAVEGWHSGGRDLGEDLVEEMSCWLGLDRVTETSRVLQKRGVIGLAPAMSQIL